MSSSLHLCSHGVVHRRPRPAEGDADRASPVPPRMLLGLAGHPHGRLHVVRECRGSRKEPPSDVQDGLLLIRRGPHGMRVLFAAFVPLPAA